LSDKVLNRRHDLRPEGWAEPAAGGGSRPHHGPTPPTVLVALTSSGCRENSEFIEVIFFLKIEFIVVMFFPKMISTVNIMENHFLIIKYKAVFHQMTPGPTPPGS
jgi:hypothetical protein